jgi:hypothetical protein
LHRAQIRAPAPFNCDRREPLSQPSCGVLMEVEKDHLSPDLVAAYLDRGLEQGERQRVEMHLADCSACRSEIVAVARLVRIDSRKQRMGWLVAGAAAAAALLLFVEPRIGSPLRDATHRDPAVVQNQPRLIAPRGAVDHSTSFVWSSMPGADRYRIVVYDPDGSSRYRQETGDTVLTVPDTVLIPRADPYYWKVEARTGWDRWLSSERADFTITR